MSPQPKKDWSKVGSGWNSARGIGFPKASPILVNASSVKAGAGAATTAATASSKGDLIYQTVVRQWCFAQGTGGSAVQGQPATKYTSGRDGGGAGLVV